MTCWEWGAGANSREDLALGSPVRHLVRSLWALVQLPHRVEGGHMLPGHWPRRTQALGTGRTGHSLPGRGLGMKRQKELGFRG